MFDDPRSAELITVMGEEAREEAAAKGRRLAAVAELYELRKLQYLDAGFTHTDVSVAVAAEVGAAHNISHARAHSLVHTAVDLHRRLPQVMAAMRRGAIDYRIVATINTRTQNVDDHYLELLDHALAARAEKWMKLSDKQLIDRIDMIVADLDPQAVRVPRHVDDNRHLHVEPANEPGIALISGAVHATDGAALHAALDALADTVCAHDPRTKAQRRADALGPLARGQATLRCECRRHDCPATAAKAAAGAAVISVLAEQATLDGTSNKPGYLPGFGVLPAESVRQLAEHAVCKPLTTPDTKPEKNYRPSTALRTYVQWRDLTCRWPGCDKPAQGCDIDHTTPWPAGPTHPSNTKPYCRTHHIVKTFLTGRGGWSERQHPDGTLELRAPTGHLYIHQPHGAAMFPALAQETGDLNIKAAPQPDVRDRIALMPPRKRSYDDEKRKRIRTERRQRAQLTTKQQHQHQAKLATNDKPPPF
ncbi:protein of uncharacterised function DUF222 [Mycolicibacterium phlei]|uniref:HNH nuclease domain-containing protein n=1 Tax=Mycolicibacterium phlei DSM 43239 = CCUG 21000 TaxID=1226750 RepID=A0A5N5UV79_MYCPH|nr:HNH endonuclease signature motif containing protein [Mycolicibacterium phlei]VEG07798.1 protein of uncharacterised function DUF222 [Mycobacteroides chelonae]AMO59669.1 hypothetical protein MPHLCCUG_00836 [Mycolicibacterium phlei]KAB7753493.1 hypothetical protein MPHL21000_19885 [Mycolicibacterium phlei DSM 43239 = CCUG 21000]KXW62396.1 hypothetical protein MPHL43239_18950 [Mycolicibacterium phlei DSM 43239 = CCUG 21000]KXW69801.1 hypothetical protein MPHL43072_03900 [Mycolicibacterium phlei